MKTMFVLFCALGAAVASHAQDKSFDLSKYKFPDYKRHQLDFNFNSSGRSDSYYTVIPPTVNYSGTTYDTSNSKSNSYFNLGYRYDLLTREKIDHLYSSVNGSYDFIKYSNSGEKTKQSQPNLNWNINASRRLYLTENKVFLEGVMDIYCNYGSRKITYNNINSASDSYKTNNLSLSAGIGIGLGRIERVNDLWQGYYILEKLKQQNSLDRELQEKDIFEFASFVSKLNNKRFFDARLQKIAELQSLDSLLRQQNLISNSDISYFTTLNDYWSFPIYFDRKSGRELKFQLTPQFIRDYYKSNEASADIPIKANLVSKVLFDCSKQLNLLWERNVHIDVINTTLLAKNGDASGNYQGNLIGSNVSFGYGFFPDSRTRLLGSVKYQGGELPSPMDSVNSKYWFNSFSLNFEANYYISPQLQITGNFSGNYWVSKHNSSHGQGTNFNLGFRYAIF